MKSQKISNNCCLNFNGWTTICYLSIKVKPFNLTCMYSYTTNNIYYNRKMRRQLSKHQIISHYQLIVDELQNVTVIGYQPLKDQYQITIFEYAKTPEKAKRPLKELVKKLDSFKEFSQVKKLTSKYSKVINAKGLLGAIRFLQGYYLFYIQQISHVGVINNKPVYIIDKISIIPLFRKFNDSTDSDENKYFQLLSSYEFQDLYFSYCYDLSSTLLENINGEGSNQFIWNYYFKEELSKQVGIHWMPNIIHGYFCYHRNSSTKLSNLTFKFDLIIISRRNRHQDGVRYLRRGINPEGYVANHVQTQQIVVLSEGMSSFLMVRGSVPIYWRQQPSFVVFQPKIQVLESSRDYQPAQQHFYQLVKRYGANIHCINLLRGQQSKPRQALLTDQFKKLIETISKVNKKGIYYSEFDVKKNLKDQQEFKRLSVQLSYYLTLQTGVNILSGNEISFQNGIARINCVDCLDRTNLFMSILGQVALVIQLKLILKQPIKASELNMKQDFAQLYSVIHEQLGNVISIQYGGSEAHKHRNKINKSQLLVSLKRHINNNTSDYVKQQQIDISHGLFSRQKPYIWDSNYKSPKTELSKTSRPRNWIEEGQKEYLQKLIRKGMTRKQNGMLEELRDQFMKSLIPKKHISLKKTQIVWGLSLQYTIEEQSPFKKKLNSNNLKSEIDKFKNQVDRDKKHTQILIQQLILDKLQNGGFEDMQFDLVEPFVREMKKKNVI